MANHKKADAEKVTTSALGLPAFWWPILEDAAKKEGITRNALIKRIIARDIIDKVSGEYGTQWEKGQGQQ